VLAVVADKPYAQPGDQVTLTMTYDDPSGATPLIAWLPGCYQHDSGQYYACYKQLASLLAGLGPGQLPPGLGVGDKFTFTFQPSDTLCDMAGNASGYETGYVFFAVCNGTLKPVPPEGSGLAGSFPIGCFDSMGNRLTESDYVPGYTQVYAFCDKRDNANPPIALGDGYSGIVVQKLDANDNLVRAGTVGPHDNVDSCPVAEADRSTSGGCGRTDPYKACTRYQIMVDVPEGVAELDPSTKDAMGNTLYETVWVDYFADGGDIDTPVLLVADPASGKLQKNTDGTYAFTTRWVAPPPVSTDAGPATQTVNIWAVVHDSRGGESVATRQLTVQ
jgi:hypothetical protein